MKKIFLALIAISTLSFMIYADSRITGFLIGAIVPLALIATTVIGTYLFVLVTEKKARATA